MRVPQTHDLQKVPFLVYQDQTCLEKICNLCDYNMIHKYFIWRLFAFIYNLDVIHKEGELLTG